MIDLLLGALSNQLGQRAGTATAKALAEAMRRYRESPDLPAATTYVEPGSGVDVAAKILPEALTARKAITGNRQRLEDLDRQLFGDGQ
jgi:hypothetical protein